jgi:glycerol-3-phosphate dehydrogenase
LLNYAGVAGVVKNGDALVDGVIVRDALTGEEFEARGKAVINATGPFSDVLRRQADPSAAPMMALSQGVHLVFDGTFLAADHAIMVPHTSDGRVMFAIPWHGHALVGTTDTPIAAPSPEPAAFEQEIDFILKTASLYFSKKPSADDVLSVFAGIRPLVRSGDPSNTAALSRDHTIRIDPSGLITICGGKWTTYRRMAEDCVNQAATLAGLPERQCITEHLNIHGFHTNSDRFGHLSVYGSDANTLQQLMRDSELASPLHPALPYTGAEIVWAARNELAVTIEDALARRTRALFLNAKAAVDIAPRAAALMARELGRDTNWMRQQVSAFNEVARSYNLATLAANLP